MNKNFIYLALLVSINFHISGTAHMSSRDASPMDGHNSKKEKHKSLFTRGSGFWTNTKDEDRNDFFRKLTDHKSQREDWYKVTPYIAEFWCAISNAGFIYYGIENSSPELLFAGVASIISHSIPKKWLHNIDLLGVGVVGAKVLTEFIKKFDVFKDNPQFIIPVIAAGCINLADAYLARTKGKTWPHVFWHLSSALLANNFLKLIKQKS